MIAGFSDFCRFGKRRMTRHREQCHSYRLSFTTGALLQQQSAPMIAIYQACRDWEDVRKTAMAENLVQARSPRTLKLLTDEIILRLQTLSASGLAMFPSLSYADQALMLWLAVCRYYEFIGDFAVEILAENYAVMKNMVSQADYAVFFNRKAECRPELDRLADSTKLKLRQTLFLIMREAGLIDKTGVIIPVSPGFELRQYLAALPGRERQFFPGLA